MFRRLNRHLDEGFTLIELLVVLTVLPLVIGAISAGFVTSLSNRDTTATRLSQSHDAQLVSTYFVRDVRSAQYVSTSNAPLCGSSSYLLGLRWSKIDSTTGNVLTDSVTYTLNGSAGTVVRTFCEGGNNSTSKVSRSVSSAAVVVDCSNGQHDCANGNLIPATSQQSEDVGVDQVKMTVSELEAGNSFDYSLTASPQGWTAVAAGVPGGGTPNLPPLDLIGNDAGIGIGPNCIVDVNGIAATANPSPNSISGGTFNATGIYSPTPNPVQGGFSPVTVGLPLADPYQGLPPPQPGDPGVQVVSGSNFPSHPSGVYYVTGDISLSGGSSIDSGNSPVLIYMAGGSISLSGSASFTLTTPVHKYDPIVLWMGPSPANPSSFGNLVFGGNGNGATIGGTIYAPNSTVSISGGGNGGGVSATGLVANQLACSGGGTGATFGVGPPVKTETVVTAAPSPSSDGKPVTLTAQVTDKAGQQTINAGNVAFEVLDKNGNPTSDCAATVGVNNSGTATCITGNLNGAMSPYTVQASYQGTDEFGPSTGATTQTVLVPTTTTLSTTAQSLHSGDTATFTATVTAADNSTPTGNVTFAISGSDGSTVSCTGSNPAALSDGTATCTSAVLLHSGSQYTVTATYAGTTSTYLGSNDSLVVPVAAASTTTTVVSSKPSSKPSQQVVFTATVAPAPAGGSIAWTITGSSGPNVNCPAGSDTLNASGQATCTISAGPFNSANSPYTVKADFSGTADYTASTGSVTQNVASVGTQTTLTSLTHSSRKYTDHVKVTGNDGGAPTGQVFFYLCANATTGCNASTPGASQSAGTVAAGGTAQSPQTARLTAGRHYCFGAVYQGDTDYLSSADTSSDQCFTA